MFWISYYGFCIKKRENPSPVKFTVFNSTRLLAGQPLALDPCQLLLIRSEIFLLWFFSFCRKMKKIKNKKKWWRLKLWMVYGIPRSLNCFFVCVMLQSQKGQRLNLVLCWDYRELGSVSHGWCQSQDWYLYRCRYRWEESNGKAIFNIYNSSLSLSLSLFL